MDKGIYTALSGGIAKGHEIELIANNLANANTPGFKRDTGTFNEYLTELRKPDDVRGVQREITAATLFEGRPVGDKSFVEMDSIYTDYRQGTVQHSGRDLDIALEGKGFLEVKTPAGVWYTRQGNLTVSADGRLVTNNGYPVLARGGAQGEGDAEGRVIRLGIGKVEITSDGILKQNGQKVAQISLQEFQEDQWLEKVGNSYFRNTDPKNIKAETAATRVHQGYVESSNVNPIKEMTRLIEATRAYESHMQAVKTYQEIDLKSVNEIVRGNY